MRIILLTALLATFLAVGHSLRCYTCYPSKSSPTRLCHDLSESVVRECEKNENACLNSLINGETTMSCTTADEKKRKEGCRESKSTKTCYCTNDLCNGATSSFDGGKMATLTVALIFTRYVLL